MRRPTATSSSKLVLIKVLVSAAIIPAVLPMAPARAQSVVSVCSGVSLPRSAITDTMAPVVAGLANPLESAVNGLLGILLPPLNINVTGLLTTAASGAPIRLNVLNQNGTIVGPDDTCRASADIFGLNQSAGLSIGGNQILGLGNAGTPSLAVDVDAIAFGNNARAEAGAVGSVAIGNNARVTVANSLALGQGATAGRGALSNYTAVGLSGPQDSAGEVSVGAAGALRQITNVAAGSAATDAATVGQVQGVAARLDTLAAGAIVYDDVLTRDGVTLAGAAGTRLANVAAGSVTAGSRDAVNGDQLFSTNARVGAVEAAASAHTTAIADLDTRATAATNAVSTLTTRVGDHDTAIADLDTRATAATNAVGTLTTRVGNHDTAIADLDTRLGATGTAVTNLDTRVTAQGTALGTLDARVTAQGTTLTDLDTRTNVNRDAIADIDARAATDRAAIATVTARTTATETTVGLHGTAIADLNARTTANTAAITALQSGQVWNGPAVVQIDARLAANEAAIAAVDARANINAQGLTDLGNRVVDNTTAIGGLDARTNVVEQAVAANTGRIAAAEQAIVATDARVTANGQGVAGANARLAIHDAAFAALDDRLAGYDSAIAQLRAGNPGAADEDGPNDIFYDTNGSGLRSNRVTLAGGDAAAPVSVDNVADAELSDTSTQAVTGRQLHATNQRLAFQGAAIDGLAGEMVQATARVGAVEQRVGQAEQQLAAVGTRVGAVEQDVASLNATAARYDGADRGRMTLAGANGTVVANVANGRVAADSTEAVNGGQLHATNQQAARAQATADTAMAVAANSVQYDAGANSVTLAGTSGDTPVGLRNVADGRTAYDAVNLGQLQDGMVGVLGAAMDYTDSRFAAINLDIGRIRQDGRAGTAGAMALSGMPQLNGGGAMISMGMGHFEGETALAVGGSAALPGGRAVVRFGATYNSRGSAGANAGVGYQF